MAARIFLAWYVVFLVSPTAVAWMGSAVPLGHSAMPLAYLLHAVCGLGLVCRAEGVSLAALWGRMAPGGGAWLVGGLKHLLLALACALLLGLALGPILPEGEQPQKDLMDTIRGANGAVPLAAVFGTVALLGPVFEEMFFRGFLLPMTLRWTMRRTPRRTPRRTGLGRRASPAAAILLSGAVFGAVHLQPAAFPLLALLGSLLGLAFLSTRDIRSAILVHACWNGGAFLFQRLLLGG